MANDENAAIALYFGGYRQSTLGAPPTAFSSWIKCIDGLYDCHVNLWRENGDSLLARWRRTDAYLKGPRDAKLVLHILGYSMGCHLAVKCADFVCFKEEEGGEIGSVTLIAPDPKFEKNGLDIQEELRGQMSAYSEAAALWGDSMNPGQPFLKAVRNLAKNDRRKICIVYSKCDTVAVWKANVGRLYDDTQHEVEWVEATMQERAGARCHCVLEAVECNSEDWIHDQLIAKTIFIRQDQN